MLNKSMHFHFMGIGGIGMSAIAKVLKKQGYKVSGCDISTDNKILKELKDLGCDISFEHNGQICKNESINALVYSTDIINTNSEIVSAKQKGISVIHRATLLAELMKQKYCVAIAGSHGKTTTSALISHIFIEAEKDPTVIIGGYLKNINNNSRFGKSEIMIVEADESDKSIEKLYPTYGIITNIDLEHLNVFKDINDIKNTFKKFIDKIPFHGNLILCKDDYEAKSMLPLDNVNIITYAIDQEANINAKNIELFPEYSTFDIYKSNEFLSKAYLNIPGKHNILNSLAAITISLELEIPIKIILEALKNFKGIERRFSFNGLYKNVEIFDDYGHHPNEILNTLHVARARAKNNLNVLFQPHRFTRTQKLWKDFVETLATYNLDNLIITDIYPASEIPIENINSLNLVNDIKKRNPRLNIKYIPIDKDFNNIISEIDNFIQPNDLLLILGAGTINKITNKLLK